MCLDGCIVYRLHKLTLWIWICFTAVFLQLIFNDRYWKLNAVCAGLHSQQRVNEKCVFLSISLTTMWFAVHVSWPPGSSSGATHCARGLPGDTWEGHYEKAKVYRYDVYTVSVSVGERVSVSLSCELHAQYLLLLACRNILLMLRGLGLCAQAILKLIIDKSEWSSQQSVLWGDNTGGH